MLAIQIPLLMIFPTLAIVAALKDATSYTIPNWISMALIAAFVPAAAVSGASLPAIGLCLVAGACGLLLGMGMFAAGWIGGGDAKLFAASALWIGVSGSVTFMLVTGLAGGVVTLVILALRTGWIAPIVAGGPAWLRKLCAHGGDLPYGVAIAVGALTAFPEAPLAASLRAGGLNTLMIMSVTGVAGGLVAVLAIQLKSGRFDPALARIVAWAAKATAGLKASRAPAQTLSGSAS
jgi:prepilin peptidase CpaA